MKLSNCAKIRIVFVGFMAAIVLGGGSAKADFTFGEPVNLGSVVNGDQWEYGHCISADGLELYYTYGGIWYPNAPGWNISVSNRPGGAGLDDIWVSRRATRNDPWGAPENLGRRASKDTEWTTPVNIGAPVNTEFAEEFPMISADGSMLYFNSDRPGGFGDGSLAGADRSDCWP